MKHAGAPDYHHSRFSCPHCGRVMILTPQEYSQHKYACPYCQQSGTVAAWPVVRRTDDIAGKSGLIQQMFALPAAVGVKITQWRGQQPGALGLNVVDERNVQTIREVIWQAEHPLDNSEGRSTIEIEQELSLFNCSRSLRSRVGAGRGQYIWQRLAGRPSRDIWLRSIKEQSKGRREVCEKY